MGNDKQVPSSLQSELAVVSRRWRHATGQLTSSRVPCHEGKWQTSTASMNLVTAKKWHEGMTWTCHLILKINNE